MFWDSFVTQCEKIEKSPSVVSEELGFNRSAVTAWKNGALPRVSSRKKIADYFGITVEELMGTKKESAWQSGLDADWADVEQEYRDATPEAKAAARAAALAVLKSSKKSADQASDAEDSAD